MLNGSGALVFSAESDFVSLGDEYVGDEHGLLHQYPR